MTVAAGVTTLDELLAFSPSGDWEGRETDLESGLEGWIEAIARENSRAGVAAAVACAEWALPIVEASYKASGYDFGSPHEEWGDSVPPVGQLARARQWLDAGTSMPKHTADYTRQLNVWDEDLRPLESPLGEWYVYFVEATNLFVMAIERDEAGGPYDAWPPSIYAARSAVCSYKSAHRNGDDRAADALQLLAAVRSAVDG